MDKLVLSPLRLGPFCTVITRLNAFCQLSLPGLSPLEVNIGSKERESFTELCDYQQDFCSRVDPTKLPTLPHSY